ncbi:MAG: hypothetical protein J6J12_01395 [Oscillospiraceae bacterium]|nr:hypothetical protein [Oscillospiraceae bacterium]
MDYFPLFPRFETDGSILCAEIRLRQFYQLPQLFILFFSELFPLQIPIPMQQIAHWLRG